MLTLRMARHTTDEQTEGRTEVGSARHHQFNIVYGVLRKHTHAPLVRPELHLLATMNDFLKKIRLKEDNICTFCKTEAESLIHLFSVSQNVLLFPEMF